MSIPRSINNPLNNSSSNEGVITRTGEFDYISDFPGYNKLFLVTKLYNQNKFAKCIQILDELLQSKATIPKDALGTIYGLKMKSHILSSGDKQNVETIENCYHLAIQNGFDLVEVSDLLFLVKMHFDAGQFDAAYFYYETTKTLKLRFNFAQGVQLYHYCGLINLQRKNQELAIINLKAGIAVFQENVAYCKKVENLVTMDAHYLGTFYNNNPDKNAELGKEAVKYFEIAAELNHAPSLYLLGYKYETGEDVAEDMEKALAYYQRAADLNNEDAILDLFRMKEKLGRDVSQELKKLSKIAGNAKIYNTLGCYYLDLYITISSNPESDALLLSSAKRYKQLAFNYIKKAVALDFVAAFYNFGIIYEIGIGVEKNDDLAIKYYTDAGDKGFLQGYENVKGIYQRKLATDPLQAAMSPIVSITNPAADPGGDIKEDEVLRHLKTLQSAHKRQSINTNNDIVNITRDNQSGKLDRIEKILSNTINSLDAINIVTTIHRLGNLTEASLDHRNFHQQKLPRIFEFLKAAESKFDSGQLTIHGIINLVEGISKLSLTSRVNSNYLFITKLYQQACKAADMEMNELVTLIYAVTRMDLDKKEFKPCLTELLNKAISSLDQLDPHSLTNLCYAVAILHCRLKDSIPANIVPSLLNHFNATLADEPDKSVNVIHCNQLYHAVFYFLKTFPELANDKLNNYIAFWQNMVMQENYMTRASKLQIEVTTFLAQYIPEPDIEKVIGTLPVDAYFSLTAKSGFILQVDGPAHYLHNVDKPYQNTPKCYFRNKILQYFDPLICVPYYAWQKLTMDKDREKYLCGLLEKKGLTLPEKWQQITKVSTKNFFNEKKSTPSTAVSSTPKNMHL